MSIKSIFKISAFCFLSFISIKGSAQSLNDCSIPPLPVVKFNEKSVKLSKTAKDSLDKIFTIIQNYRTCKIEVLASNNHAKGAQIWDRVSAVINYFK